MHLSIHSLKNTLFDQVATQLTVPTTTGEITILDNHRALITLLKKGVATIIDDEDKEKKLTITGGFLEVKPNNEVTVLIEE